MAATKHFGSDESRAESCRLRIVAELLKMIFLVFDQRDGLEADRATRILSHVLLPSDILSDLREDELAVFCHERSNCLKEKNSVKRYFRK